MMRPSPVITKLASVSASRRVRTRVAPGSMPYSAVTQPRPWPLSHGGSRSSRVAVTSTWVSPNLTMQEPSAYLTTPRSSDTGRSSSGARRLGRMGNPPRILKKAYWLAVLVGGGTGSGKALASPLAASFTVALRFLRSPPPRSLDHRLDQSLLVTGARDGQIRVSRQEYPLAHHEPIGLIAPHAGLAQLNER